MQTGKVDQNDFMVLTWKKIEHTCCGIQNKPQSGAIPRHVPIHGKCSNRFNVALSQLPRYAFASIRIVIAKSVVHEAVNPEFKIDVSNKIASTGIPSLMFVNAYFLAESNSGNTSPGLWHCFCRGWSLFFWKYQCFLTWMSRVITWLMTH